MEETTTPQPVRVTGQPHDHPSMRRLARACLALARWQRSRQSASLSVESRLSTPGSSS